MLLSLIKDILRSGAPKAEDELARAGKLLEISDYIAALGILDDVLQRNPDHVDALLLRAVARRLANRPKEAIVDLQRLHALNAETGETQFQLSMCWAALGDIPQAISHCEKARRLMPESSPIFGLLFRLSLSGDFYTDVLARIVAHLAPTTYVEIGVFEGTSLKYAKSARAIVGIDPDPKITWTLDPHIKIFKTTSDAFFAEKNLVAELGGRKVDLAFIDGMHQFEFAMRDFANVERSCHKDSVVLIHDCYPMDEESAGREPRSNNWSGDVWRMIVLLKKYRPDLVIHTIGAAPTGLAVIHNLDPQSTFLMDNQESLYKEFLALDYSYLDQDKDAKLNRFPNEWPAIEKMLMGRSAPVA